MVQADLSNAQKNLSGCLLILSFFKYYSLLMFVPIMLVGTFVSVEIVLVGVLHLVIGLGCEFSRILFLARSIYGRWLAFLIGLFFLSASGMMIKGLRDQQEPLVTCLFPLIIMILAASLIFLLFRRDVAEFFHHPVKNT